MKARKHLVTDLEVLIEFQRKSLFSEKEVEAHYEKTLRTPLKNCKNLKTPSSKKAHAN